MGRRELSHTVGGNISGAVTVENIMEVSQKTKSRTTTQLLGIYMKKTKTQI